MDPFSMVVAIVAIVTVGRVLTARLGRRRAAFEAPHELVSRADGTRMRHEIDRLNARVQVLERLATDPSRRLSDEIDALGHGPHRPS